MTQCELEELDRCLPRPNPYTRWAEREQSRWPAGSRLVRRGGLNFLDPALLWDLLNSFANEKQPLPEFFSEDLRRAYRYILGQEDLHVALAHMLSLPASRLQTEVLHALMICNETTHEGLAELSGWHVDVIRFHNLLFWNVIGRKHEFSYIRAIYQRPAPAEAKGSSDIDLLSLAFKVRSVNTVLAAADVPCAGARIPVVTLLKLIRRAYLTSGLAKAAVDEASDEVIGPALKIIARLRDQPSTVPEQRSRPTIAEGAQLVLRQLLERTNREEALQQAQIVAESNQKAGQDG